MKPVNNPSGAGRVVEAGLVWQEVYNGAGGFTIEIPYQSTFRVSAAADVTVTLDGVLAMTLRTGEVERFNAGSGTAGDGKVTVTLVIGAGSARLQLAAELDPGRRTR